MLLSMMAAFPVTVRAASSMKASGQLISVLKAMEGFSAKPYWDYSQWTVGYGTKCPDDKLEQYKTYGIPEADAEALLSQALVWFETAVNGYIDQYGLSLKQHQFDALVSLSYNCGEGWMNDTNGYLNIAVREGGSAAEILYGFCLWSTAGGDYILKNRRLCEANMYINGVYKAYNADTAGNPRNLRCVYLDGNGGEVLYKIYGFDANAETPVRVAFSSIPTGVDGQGNVFVYRLEGWYTADGMKVQALDHSIQDGEVLYARWADPAGKVVSLPKGEAENLNVTITGDSVRVRTGPATYYPQVSTYYKNTVVNVTETYQTGNYTWGKTSFGWFRLDYSNYAQAQFPKYGTITTDGVNVRTGPGTSNDSVGKLNKGERVTITEEATGEGLRWGKMTNGNWVCLSYVTYDATAKTVAGVTLLRQPDQLTYVQKSESLRLEGSVLQVSYSDGSTSALTLTRSMVTQFNNANLGQTTVTASYKGYTVSFPVTITKATVTFQNWDGTVLSSNQYAYGETVTAPATPTRADEGIYTFAFSGWDKTVTSCLGNAVYTAVFGKTEKTHSHPANGWYAAGNKWYLYENNALVRNQWRKDTVGWIWLTADGSMLTDGWAKDSANWYYMGADGYAVTNSWKKDSIDWIWLGGDGCMTKSAWVLDKGVWYWMDADGYMARSTWVKEGENRYYLNRFGEMVTNGWVLDGAHWYKTDGNGHIIKNAWQKDSKGWVRLGSDGAMVINAWLKDSYDWCYVGSDGYVVTNSWAKDSAGWCYMNSAGYMTKNKWVQDGGKWYFLDKNGYMVSNKWMKDANGWVYLGSGGAMVTNGWAKDSAGWCYMNSAGYMTKDSWILDGGKWYYLNGNGYMLTNTSLRYNGKTYYFNASGVCTNP